MSTPSNNLARPPPPAPTNARPRCPEVCAQATRAESERPDPAAQETPEERTFAGVGLLAHSHVESRNGSAGNARCVPVCLHQERLGVHVCERTNDRNLGDRGGRHSNALPGCKWRDVLGDLRQTTGAGSFKRSCEAARDAFLDRSIQSSTRTPGKDDPVTALSLREELLPQHLEAGLLKPLEGSLLVGVAPVHRSPIPILLISGPCRMTETN